jgi:peptidoglycan/LPS O-acetylase OafA/YrhL
MSWVGSITELAFFRGSGIFVDFFFVLSGFVLTHSYGFNNHLTLKPFIVARFFRLYPLHLFMLAIFIVLELAKLAAFNYGGLVFTNEPFSGDNAIHEILPNLLLLQSWLPFTSSLSFNYPSWSISIEYYIYLLFFITLTLFKKIKIIAWFLILLIMLLLIETSVSTHKIEALKGLACFFGGALTYILYKNFNGIKISPTFGSVIEILLILIVVYIAQAEFSYRAIIAIPLFCLTVLVFAFESGFLTKPLKLPLFQTMGKLSYSIYMIHAAILIILIAIMLAVQKITGIELAPIINEKRALTLGNSTINSIAVFIVLALVVYLANFTHKYVEVKGKTFGKKFQIS